MTQAIASRAALPRLLAGLSDGPLTTLERHHGVHGVLPSDAELHGEALVELIADCALRGRGGAAFPVARKLRAVMAARGRPTVVANGSESEPLSGKDALLLRELPHLVLDGAELVARAVGAPRAIIAVKGSAAEHGLLERAIGERRALGRDQVNFELFAAAEGFISGQETALVSQINGGNGLPAFQPPRVSERGVARRPTLVQNVETLAQIALIARHGVDWYRAIGTAEEPGSTLITLVRAGAGPAVYEVAYGTPLHDVLAAARIDATALGGLLIGGYFGTWLSAGLVNDVRLSHEALDRHDASLGCGVIAPLPASACPVAETVRVSAYLAAQSAGQCGPCVHGSAAIARRLEAAARGTAGPLALEEVRRWTLEIRDRGACHHPTGIGRFVASALRTFRDQFEEHARHGPCAACTARSLLA